MRPAGRCRWWPRLPVSADGPCAASSCLKLLREREALLGKGTSVPPQVNAHVPVATLLSRPCVGAIGGHFPGQKIIGFVSEKRL
jgi:hypothetical protein